MKNNKFTNEQQWKLLVLLLKKIAEHKKISQYEIADKTGLHQSNVNRVFNLTHSPTLKVFIAIAQAIGINFFFEDKEGDSPLNELFEKAMTELGRRTDNLPKN